MNFMNRTQKCPTHAPQFGASGRDTSPKPNRQVLYGGIETVFNAIELHYLACNGVFEEYVEDLNDEETAPSSDLSIETIAGILQAIEIEMIEERHLRSWQCGSEVWASFTAKVSLRVTVAAIEAALGHLGVASLHLNGTPFFYLRMLNASEAENQKTANEITQIRPSLLRAVIYGNDGVHPPAADYHISETSA